MATKLETLTEAAVRLGKRWYHIPGRERFTLASLPSDLSLPTSSMVFPLPKHVGKIPAFITGKGPNSGGAFGYARSSGARTHAGVDLFASRDKPWEVLAVADGTIVNFYHFYRGTFALIVNHGSFVVNYGEVRGDSLDKLGLKTPSFRDGTAKQGSIGPTITSSSKNAKDFPWVDVSGSSVKAGQHIAWTGKMFRDSMLHFEAYSSGTSNKGWGSFPSGAAPSALLNPTSFLQELKSRNVTPTRQIDLPPIHLGSDLPPGLEDL